MTEIKKQKFKNNLKAYFSKPANIITVLFLVLLIAAVVVPLFTLLIGSFKINGNQEALYTGIPDGSFTIAHWKELLTSKDFDYAKIKFSGEKGEDVAICMECQAEYVMKKGGYEKFEILERFKGKDMVGMAYRPPFDIDPKYLTPCR